MGDKEIDALFHLPLSEFIAARNSLSNDLKRAGNTDEAARIKALPKPPLSAWVVNQLYWRHDTLFNRLMSATERLRTAQAGKLAGDSTNLRDALEARNAAVSELAKAGTHILRESGHPPSPDTMRRAVTTLEALATYGRQPGGPAAGRLTNDVESQGFAALATLAPAGRGDRPPSRVIPFAPPTHPASRQKGRPDPEQTEREQRRKIADAQKTLADAQRTLAQASRGASQARAEMKEAAARARAVEKTRASLEAQLEKATAEAESVRQQAHRVAARAEEASQQVDDAERAVTEAREALKALQSSFRT